MEGRGDYISDEIINRSHHGLLLLLQNKTSVSGHPVQCTHDVPSAGARRAVGDIRHSSAADADG